MNSHSHYSRSRHDHSRHTLGRSRRAPQRGASAQRRGGILIVAMICLVLMTAVSVTLIRMAGQQAKQTRLLEQRHQAEALALAGLDRAVALLATNADYSGETWNIPADQLGQPGSVTLSVLRDTDGDASTNTSGQARVVTAQAHFPAAGDERAQVTLTRTVRVTVPMRPAAAASPADSNDTTDAASPEPDSTGPREVQP